MGGSDDRYPCRQLYLGATAEVRARRDDRPGAGPARPDARPPARQRLGHRLGEPDDPGTDRAARPLPDRRNPRKPVASGPVAHRWTRRLCGATRGDGTGTAGTPQHDDRAIHPADPDPERLSVRKMGGHVPARLFGRNTPPSSQDNPSTGACRPLRIARQAPVIAFRPRAATPPPASPRRFARGLRPDPRGLLHSRFSGTGLPNHTLPLWAASEKPSSKLTIRVRLRSACPARSFPSPRAQLCL